MSFLNIAQQIIFDRLTGNLGSGVSLFDTAPYLPEGAPSTLIVSCVRTQPVMASGDPAVYWLSATLTQPDCR